MQKVKGNILAILNVRVPMDRRNPISAAQLRAARSLLNWSRVRLGAKANLSEMAISDFENGVRTPRPHNVMAIRQAIEDAGIVLTDEGTPSIGPTGETDLATNR